MNLALRVAWWSYWLGVAYWAGRFRGAGVSGLLGPLVGTLGWPVAALYGLVWGDGHRRRWFCALKGHRWRPVPFLQGPHRPYRQCRRCWLVDPR